MLALFSEAETTDMVLERTALVMEKIGVPASSGNVIVSQTINYQKWHIANLYYGDSDGFLIIDQGKEVSSFGINGKYITQSLTNVQIGFYPSTGHYSNAYVGEVLIFNEKLSDSDRSMVTSYLMSKWGISSSGNTTCTESSIDESVSVISELQSLKPPKCMRPGGTGLFFDGTSWLCECVENATHVYHGTSCENTCTQNSTHFWNTTTSSCQEKDYSGVPRIDDIWYRSPNLSGGSAQQGTSSILSQLKSMTTCSRETWVKNYQDCALTAWREVRAVIGFSIAVGSTSYDMYFDTNGANKGYNNFWKCYGWCGNGDPFYTQNNNYIVVSSKYYQFVAGTTYAIQYFVDDSATIYLQSEGSSTLDITLSNAVNGSPYGKVVSFSATETKAYRIIATIGNGVYDNYFHIYAVTNALELKCDGSIWSTCYAVEI